VIGRPPFGERHGLRYRMGAFTGWNAERVATFEIKEYP
jgi:hypothetical protein